MNYEKPEKSYMFVSKQKYFKAQEDMLKFIESMISIFSKQKYDILQQMHEATLWYEKDEKN